MCGFDHAMKRSVLSVAYKLVTNDRDLDASELFKKTILTTIVIPLLILFFSELVLYCLGFDALLRGKPDDYRIRIESSAFNDF
jgi:hypothetical protein